MSVVVHTSSSGVPWRDLLLPWRAGKHLFQHQFLIRQFTRREVLGKYRGAFLGILWSFLNPLIMLGIYTIVFGFIFKARYGQMPNESSLDYTLALFCSLNIFHFFTEVMNRAPILIVDHPNFITKVVFPLEIFGMTAIGSALIHLIISMMPLLIALFWIQGGIHLTALYLFLLLIPLMLFAVGITWVLSSVGIFLRDIQSLVAPLMLVILYVSAVFYPLNKVPENFRWLFELNPLAQIIDQSRRVMIWGMPLDWQLWILLLIGGMVAFHAGYAFFMKTKHIFADKI